MSNKDDQYFNITFQGELQKECTVKMQKHVFNTQLSQIRCTALPTFIEQNQCFIDLLIFVNC